MSQQWNQHVIAEDAARESLLRAWLQTIFPESPFALAALKGAASFRRYFRVETPSSTYIAMDAPPQLEDITRFVSVAKHLQKHHFLAPTIHNVHESHGFLLLDDFGDCTVLDAFDKGSADTLYKTVLDALVRLQQPPLLHGIDLPVFGEEWLAREWEGHCTWFLRDLLGFQTLPSFLHEVYEALAHAVLQQPRVFMYRDLHAANLMLLPDGRLGLLDFQDAMLGPYTYDLASLLRDCYVAWSPEEVNAWLSYYMQHMQTVNGELLQWDDLKHAFDWMSVQRHLKALFTFARKALRDASRDYLQHVPRTLQYIISESAGYRELLPLHDFYANIVLPRAMELLLCEA